MSTRSHGAVLGVLAALVLTVLAVAAWRFTTQEASANQVAVSVDGVRWTADLEDAFFFSDSAWTPGQTRTAVFWVRNDADVDADVSVTVSTSSGEALTESGQVALSAAIGGGDDFRRFAPGRGVNTVRIGTLDPGKRETVTLRAEHVGEVEVDSALLRHHISGSGTSIMDDSRLDASDARLELAPLFLCVALVVTLVVMRRTRTPPKIR